MAKKTLNLEVKEIESGDLLVFGGSTSKMKRSKFTKFINDLSIMSLHRFGYYPSPYNHITEELLYRVGVKK